MKKPIALIDLDGTLADFAGAMARDLALLRAPEEPAPLSWDDEKQPPHIKARWKMIKQQPDWWAQLEYLESGRWLVETLTALDYKLHILSRAPRRLASAWEQKIRWCARHVPDVQVTLTPQKDLVYGRVLVDDWPAYVEPWLKARPRGLVILPDQPWNQGLEHPRIARHKFGENDAEIKATLKMHRTAT